MGRGTALPAVAAIGVVGAGAMGAGIAQVALRAGHVVHLTDADPRAAPDASRRIEAALAREVEKGRRTRAWVDEALSRLVLAPHGEGLSALSACGLVIEAIVEQLDAKQRLLSALEDICSIDCILATNTSSLSIASLGAAVAHPERVVGMHFFNPAPVLPLVEVIPGVRTSADVAGVAVATAEAWGKAAVVATDTPGFIVNRVARPYYGESLRILEEGIADAATIDEAMRERGGFRMGPFELMDFIGHDVNYVVTETVWQAMYYDPRYRPSLTQKRLVEAGLLGRKSGSGFYDYRDGAARPEPDHDAALGEAIVLRIVSMLVNEAVDAVHLRVASPEDVERAMTMGMNYPRGLLAWGDELRPARVLAELDRLHSETGDARYRASLGLRQCVRDGRPLAP